MTLLCPHGDSNSGLSLERAPSWAARRWGQAYLLSGRIVSCLPQSFFVKRAGLYHPNSQSSTSVLAVLWTSVLAVLCTSVLAAICSPHGRRCRVGNRVHEKDTEFTWSMHADRQRHFDVCASGRSGDDDRSFGLAQAG
jgi:hypothetical protein